MASRPGMPVAIAATAQATPLLDHRHRQDHPAYEPHVGRVEQGDLGVQTGVGEEQRQEQRDAERLDTRHQIACADPARNRGPHDERTEHRVQANQVGEPGAECHHRQAGRPPGLGQLAVLYHPILQPREDRPHHEEHKRHIGRPARDVPGRLRPGRIGRGQHDGEQAPGGRVANGPRAQRHGADRRARQLPVMDEPGQDRQGGDAHRGAKEQHRLDSGGPRREELGVVEEDPSQTGAEQEGRQHPGERDGHRAAEVARDDVDPELHADDEHVQSQTELGHRKRPCYSCALEARRRGSACRLFSPISES